MQPNSNQAHSHSHSHDHAHGSGHGHDHSHAQAHPHGPDSLLPPQPAKDLKSPVLSGLAQRLLWVTSVLVVLWLAVFWALRTHG
jgi:hypothetical protein